MENVPSQSFGLRCSNCWWDPIEEHQFKKCISRLWPRTHCHGHDAHILMAAISVRGNNGLLSRLKALAELQRYNYKLVGSALQGQFYREMGSASVDEKGHGDISKWKKVDSKACGITNSMISLSSWTVLKLLRSAGFEAYLVGGCVRDLLLKRIPKDFDVITTAKLKQIRQKFHRARIVGRRFPICMVNIKGSIIEVSSFETKTKPAEETKKLLFSKIPKGCDERDLIRWRDSMHRDFTVNSLFFDPFVNKIYDYANGMTDLKLLKLRTLMPAQLSFKEDCARILRGLRIAARLGLSISKETETAILNLSSSIKSLAQSRIMMEMNYMLSYGAAEPSLCLLRRFNLLEILLPFHAAYLDRQDNKQTSERSTMLMQLFFNFDKMVTCDRPSSCGLWVGLLAFHLALVQHPQDALVVWSFSSILYHGNWKEGIKFAREHAQMQVNFIPEITKPCDYKSDKDLIKKVTQFASLVQTSIDALTDTDCLVESMSRFSLSPCSALVFVPKKTGKDVAQLLNVLVTKIESYIDGRTSFEIDYNLLGKGDLHELSFVLGKVILDTMDSGIVQGKVVKEKNHLHASEFKQNPNVVEENCHLAFSDLIKHQVVNEDKKRSLSHSNPEVHIEGAKKQKLIENKCNILQPVKTEEKQKLIENECNISHQVQTRKKQRPVENMKCPEVTEKLKAIESQKGQKMSEKNKQVPQEGNWRVSQDEVTKKQQKVVDRPQLSEVGRIMTGKIVPEKKKLLLPPQEKQMVVETLSKKYEERRKKQMVESVKHNISLDEATEKHPNVKEKCDSTQEEKNKKHKQLEKSRKRPLSSIFK